MNPTRIALSDRKPNKCNGFDTPHLPDQSVTPDFFTFLISSYHSRLIFQINQ